MSPPTTPPQPPPNWSHSPQDLRKELDAAIASAESTYNTIAALNPSECTLKSVFLALADSESELEAATESLFFYQNVAISSELRDAASDAEVKLSAFRVDAEMRQDIYQAKLHAKVNMDGAGTNLSVEEKRLVEKMLLEGKRAGLALPEKQRDVLTEKKKLLSQKCVQFTKNYNEEKGFLSFTAAELDGVPKDVINGYTKRANELYDVTFKTPDIFPVLKFATNPETRKRAIIGLDNRLAVNEAILDEILVLRRELASLLGYPTWADYIIEEKMAKTAQTVFEFLDDLQTRLRPLGHAERDKLLRLKEEECAKYNFPFDGEFHMWDYRYYDRLFTERKLEFDTALLKAYFPVDVIVPTILQIYQDLLGVKFYAMSGETWHPEVQQFTVWKADAKDETDFLGYCYLDLFPREAKYSHAAVWQLVSGYTKLDGGRIYPVTAMVANLAKPTPQNPALMTHDDVVTFFHEMGHAFHVLLSNTRFGRFHGTSVARDFVEAPSQMLENWCFEPKVLEKMSSHYETKQPLGKELIDKLIKSRYVNVGLYYLRQLFHAKFDMKIHTSKGNESTTRLWNEMRQEISLVKVLDKHAPGQGSFGHLTSGYDAGYYGYMYSLVFAADMYETVFKRNPLSPELGHLYRDKILGPGSSRDEIALLEDFLGRKPTTDAFLQQLFGSETVQGSDSEQVKNSL